MTGIVHGIISFWARNRVASNLLMILAFAGGIFALNVLEKESFPVLQLNVVRVEVSWPGASPKDVEEQIVLRIEEAVNDLDGLKRLTSVSREGYARINLETHVNVDINAFINEVKNRVDGTKNLPEQSFRPSVVWRRLAGEYIGLALHGNIDLRELKRTAEQIRDEMAKLPGGDLAYVQGVLNEEVTIELSESAMRRYGLDFDSVAQAIRSSSVNQSGGEVRADTGSVTLQVRSLADTREQFESIIIRQTAGGGIVSVGDVASVQDGFIDADLESHYLRRPAAFIFFLPPDTMDLPAYSKAIEDYVEEKNKILPEALELTVLWSDNDFMSEMVRIISNSAFLGITMVLLLLVLFLRPIVAFWVAIGIATAFAGGLALLPSYGVSLNILALFGCLVVIGVVVDDAIIIGENIHADIEKKGSGGVDVVIEATHNVARPVIFGVLTTMIAFAPWALLSTPERQFTQHLTLTVIAALTFSLIEAFCILPRHLAHMKPQKMQGRWKRFSELQARISHSLIWFAQTVYRPMIRGAIKYRYATVAGFISLFIFAIGLVANGQVKGRFTPEIQGVIIVAEIDLPDGSPYSRTLAVRDRLQDAISELIAETDAKYPDATEPIVLGGSVVATATRIQSWVGLSEPQNRPDEETSTKALSERLRELMGPVEDAEEISFDFSFDNDDNSLRFSLRHDDLDALQAAATELRQKLARYPSTYGMGDNLSSPGEEARFTLKPGAEALGVSLAQVGKQVRQAYYGEEVQRLPRDGDDVRVMLRLPESARRSLDSLRDFRIRTADGREIPLPELVDIEFFPGIDRIQHRDRQRAVTVFTEAEEDARGLIAEDIKQDYLPELQARYPGLSIEEIGQRQRRGEFTSELIVLQSISFVIMYVLLAVAFSSYFQPLLIMTAIPFGVAGAVFAHLIMGVPLALFSMFGIAAAAGVVINDNLVLVDYVNRLRDKGEGVVESLINAGVSRFRPVFLTSLTTVVGVMPMLFDRSVQGQFLTPMVLSLAGAVTFALFVTLFLVPALYAAGTEIRRGLAWMLLGRPYKSLGSSLKEWNTDDAVAEPAQFVSRLNR